MKWILAVACAAMLVGCNKEDAQNLGQDAKNVAQHATEAVGGVTLAGKVNTMLAWNKHVDIKTLHVEAKDGVVTIGGHVTSNAEKQRVLQIINDTVGVEKVVDHLRVEPR